jgi:hypothetical protein
MYASGLIFFMNLLFLSIICRLEILDNFPLLFGFEYLLLPEMA